MPSTKKTKKQHKSYYLNDVLEWERQAKEEEEAKLAQQKEDEEKEWTKRFTGSAGGTNFNILYWRKKNLRHPSIFWRHPKVPRHIVWKPLY